MNETKLSPPVDAAGSNGSGPSSPKRTRILLVEGDGFTRLVLLLRLRLAGFAVDFTSNGVLGLGKLRSCHPDILLVDLKLYGLSGLELIKAARAEPEFGNRPIYVFTRADRMNRTSRKEVGQLGTELFDKNTITREDLVQILTTTFLKPKETERPARNAEADGVVPALSLAALSGAIEELIAGVRDQCELLARETGDRLASGGELLSRVCSLASCAKAAGLQKLAQQAKALENLLTQLSKTEPGYTDAALSTVTRSVDVMSRMPFETTGKAHDRSEFSAVFVDESPNSNRAMEEALLNAGFKPVCFEEPARARQYLASNRTDLILANVVLPEGHGLALTEIRQIPLQAHTPVVFVPESSLIPPLTDELPISAPRLDKAPLLVAELVVRALNEVQKTNPPAPVQPVSAASDPRSAGHPLGSPGAQASLPQDDGFELFSKTPRPSVQPYIDPRIPSEPIMRAQPDVPGADSEAELLEQLQVTPIDGTIVDERPLESLPLSVLQAEVPPSPEPEPTAEDQTATFEWRLAEASDNGDAGLVGNAASELEQNEAVVEEAAGATSNNGEVMNNEFYTAPAEPVLREASQPIESSNGHNGGREDLAARVCASEMALYHAQVQIERRDKVIEALQKQLAETTAGQGQPNHELAVDAPAEPSEAERIAKARCAELEEEVTALRQAFEGLNGGLGEAQQSSAEAAKQVQELEQRLSQNAAELDKQREEQKRVEAELRSQLDAANASRQESESARQQAQARGAQMEQELGSLRKKQEEQKGTDSGASTCAPASELEQQVRQGVAALAKATAELAKERGERQRSQQLAAELNGRLQALHQDLSRTLKTQGENLSRINALEQEHRQASEALERSTADLEQQQAERRLAEAQLQKAKETNAQLRKDLSFFDDANRKFDGSRQELQTRLEASLNGARENEARLQQETAERRRLAESLEEARRELQSQSRKRESLEQELQVTRDELQEREAKLHQETAERQRLNEVQDSAQNGTRDNPERDLEFSKLQSALQIEQVERKRQETQLARTRQSALEAAHAARALRTSLRRQIREPVDNLIHSARSLLEQEMGEDQKKLAEAMLQDVLLVQTRLREPGTVQADSPEASSSQEAAGT